MRFRWRASLFLLTSMMAMGCSAERDVADIVFVGGRVWTGKEPSATRATDPTAVAVSGDQIVAVGGDAEIRRLVGPGTLRVDLSGRRIVPGFIDNHTHFIDGGFGLASVQLRDATTPEEFARRIGAYAAAHPGEWVLGGTWDHELWGGELPTRAWIDSLTPETPVFVSRLDGHMSLANSRALELAGIDATTADPPGGTIERYDGGRPAGVLKDAAQALVFRVIPDRSASAVDDALSAAARHAAAHGVTMITDMGSWAGLAAYRRAHAAGRLPLRVYSLVPIASWERMAEYVANEGRGDDRLFWGGVKGFVDGSLGSTTAWFYEPYDDAPGETGLIVTDSVELRQSIIAADAAGLHVIVHAIGDRANDWLLDAFEDAVTRNGPRDRRFRIEHAQHLRSETIRRLARNSVIASMQPYHAIDDGRWAEKRIGAGRMQTTYAFRDILAAGGRLTFGSDWTVAPLDPLLGIYAAVTRRTIDGANPGGWVPAQKITVAEAVHAYTVANAWASYREDRLGTIEAGKYADLVVLSHDLFEVDPVDIATTQVDLTVVGGRIVFER